jgi:hypothetical protein
MTLSLPSHLSLVLVLLLSSGCDNSANDVRTLEAENAAFRQAVGIAQRYVCKVVGVRELSDSGFIEDAPEPVKAGRIGLSFVVNRDTGEITGDVGNNATYETNTVVFTPPNNRFHVVSISHGPNRSVNFLSIQDWAAGPKKPFLLVESGSVYSGTCE